MAAAVPRPLPRLPRFLSTRPLVGDVPFRWSDYTYPKLHQFARAREPLIRVEYIGSGVSGTSYKVYVGRDKTPLGLKYPTAGDVHNYGWPVMCEARVAATLQMINTALRVARRPIKVPKNPATWRDVVFRLYAFSAQGIKKECYDTLPVDDAVTYVLGQAGTRVRKCLGWVDIAAAFSFSWRDMRGSLDIGIMYEYIPPAPLDTAAVREQLDFFYHCGILIRQLKEDNWSGSGTLLDLGDLAHPAERTFVPTTYREHHINSSILVEFMAFGRRVMDLERAGKFHEAYNMDNQDQMPRGTLVTINEPEDELHSPDKDLLPPFERGKQQLVADAVEFVQALEEARGDSDDDSDYNSNYDEQDGHQQQVQQASGTGSTAEGGRRSCNS